MLDEIIPPEIKNDFFYLILAHFASNPNFKTFLEIGSSSGGGSTEAFVNSIRSRPDKADISLFCMEISAPRFTALKNTYRNDLFVKPYQCSSIALSEFPEPEEVINFYHRVPSALNSYSLDQVMSWYSEDIKYLEKHGMVFNGIEKIKIENGIKTFDMVLIDGSEFSGERDLHSVIGSKLIALDDINAFKCYNAFQILSHHSSYRLINCDLNTRNGFGLFERLY
jgi:hypothetical protein